MAEVYSWEPSSRCSPCCQEAVTVSCCLGLFVTGDKSLEDGGMNWTAAVMSYDGRVVECKYLFSDEVFCLCEAVEHFQEIFFFVSEEIYSRSVWSTRASILWVGEYASGTRNHESIACLFGHACADGLFSVYIWRDFHTESLEWVVIYCLRNRTSNNLLSENKVYFGQDFLQKETH